MYNRTIPSVNGNLKTETDLLQELDNITRDINLGYYNQSARNIRFIQLYLEHKYYKLGITKLSRPTKTCIKEFSYFEHEELFANINEVIEKDTNFNMDAEETLEILEKDGIVILSNYVLTLRHFVFDGAMVDYNQLEREHKLLNS